MRTTHPSICRFCHANRGILVDVEGASDVEDVRDRDRIWSLNGIQIFSPEQWREAWQDRPKDRPCTVEVIRNTPVSDSGVGYVEERKTVTIAPGSRISIRCMAKQTRYHNLID